MPVDASILLSNLQPIPKAVMPSEARAAALDNQLRAAQLQAAQQTLKDKQVFQQAWQQSGGDLDAALGAYASVSPEHALDVERIKVAKQQQSRIDAEMQQRASQGQDNALRERQKNFDTGLYSAVSQAKPEERDAVFLQYVEQGRADGLRDLPQGLAAIGPRAGRWGVLPASTQPKAPGQHVIGDALVDDTGKVIYKGEPKPTADKAPTEASLALEAAKGDETARAALKILREQNQKPTGTSGADTAAKLKRDALVKAVLANPTTYDKLTPTAQTDLLPDLAAAGFKFSGSAGSTAKPPTGAQTKVLGFFQRAKQADEDLASVEEEFAKKSQLGQAWDTTVGSFLQSNVGRQFTQAQRAFTEARLRKDSGAAIPPAEYENDRKTYFPVAGDDAKTIENKRRARAGILATLAYESGPALAGFYGDDAASLVKDYQTKAKSAAAPVKVGRFTVEVE